MSKKAAPSKRMSDELRRAQYLLDSACIRGHDQAVIDQLRAQRDSTLVKEKK